jgi:NadR type nicotinamide-nucleotide adenylyltransferase
VEAVDDGAGRVSARPPRVVLCGPESTGKSTLAERLAGHYGTRWVPEFLRQYVERRLARLAPGAPLVEETDLRAIVEGQLRAEEALGREAQGVLFCDTDPLQTAVYAEHYFGHSPDWLRALVAERRYELTLLLDVAVPWTPDPLRDRPLQREDLHALFLRTLEAHGGRPFVRIGGGWPEREATARAAIDLLLGS